MTSPICLFDSGIGGLTVLKKLIDRYPNENYIYLADLARVPFGDKTKEEIKIIVSEIIDWLVKFNPKIIIMACNTSSAILSSELQALSSKLQVPIYGMIESCAKEITKSNYKKISVWATKLVVENNSYKNAIHKMNPNIEIEEIACPKLVPMIEDLSFPEDKKNKIIFEYRDKISKDSEELILGCTHYPLIKEDLRKLLKTKITDPADSLVNDLEKYLLPSNNSSNKKQVALYSTAQIEKVKIFSKAYLQEDFKVNQISLNKIKAKI